MALNDTPTEKFLSGLSEVLISEGYLFDLLGGKCMIAEINYEESKISFTLTNGEKYDLVLQKRS